MRSKSSCSAAGTQRDTLICLHGSASSPRQWQRLAERVAPRFRVVAPALIGYTDGPPWSEHQVNALIVAFLDSQGARGARRQADLAHAA